MLQTEDRFFLKRFGVHVKSETFYNNHNHRIFFRIGKWRHRFARLDISFHGNKVCLFMCVEDASLLNNSGLAIIINKIKHILEEHPLYRIRFLVGDLSYIISPTWVDARIRPKKEINNFFLFASLIALWLISMLIFMFIFAVFLVTFILFSFLRTKWGKKNA